MEKINFYGNLGLIMLLSLSFSYSIYAQNVNEIEKELLQKAEKNIEKYRKGTVSLQFKAAGDRLEDADVTVEQVNHDFLFGCIIFPLIWDEDPYRPQLFKERFKALFNFAVFPFYWPSYERQQGMPGWEKMIETLEWCKANDITTNKVTRLTLNLEILIGIHETLAVVQIFETREVTYLTNVYQVEAERS